MTRQLTAVLVLLSLSHAEETRACMLALRKLCSEAILAKEKRLRFAPICQL